MNFKEVKSIYIQIAERLCDGILQDEYAEGERIPSVREYAAVLEVNVNTVVKSYDYLSAKEVLFNRRGLGYFVAEGAKEHIAQLRREEFMHDELPEFFRRLRLLNIPIETVVALYEKQV